MAKAKGLMDDLLDFFDSQGGGVGARLKKAVEEAKQNMLEAEAAVLEAPERLRQAHLGLMQAAASGVGIPEAKAEMKRAQANSAQVDSNMEAAQQQQDDANNPSKQALARAKPIFDAVGKSGVNTRTSDVGGVDMMDVGKAAMGDPEAIMQVALDTAQHSSKNLQAAGEHLGNAATSTTASGAAAEGVRGAGSTASAALGPIVGPEVEKIFKFTAALIESVDKLRSWGNSLHQANMQFAEFSGNMAAVQGRQEVRDIQLSQQRGDRRAGSAEDLAQAKNRMDRAVAPIDDAWNNLQNRVAAWILNVLAPIMEQLSNWLPGLGNSDAKDDPELNKNDWMVNTFTEKWYETHGKPERFK